MTQLLERDLESLDGLWADGLGAAYDAYFALGPDPRVALAAALTETAVSVQRIGEAAAPAGPLLLADLCLARASRLLAEVRDVRLQVGFARAIESVSARAAAGTELPDLRTLLTRVISG
jgi:hypothetical protein